MSTSSQHLNVEAGHGHPAVAEVPSGRLPPATRVSPLRWDGLAGPLAAIAFTNLLLALVTLGFYRFWGVVRVRRFVWAHLALLGDRLEYSGTGGELLRGFLLAMLVLVPFFAVLNVLEQVTAVSPALEVATSFFDAAVFVFLFGTARYAARRYVASRTMWSGIRFALDGSPWTFGWLLLKWVIAVLITFGVAMPFATAAWTRWRIGRLRLGTLPFVFGGTGRQLLRPFLLSALLTIPTLGLVWFWYSACVMRWSATGTEFGNARFSLPDVGAVAVARLRIGNALLLILTLGLLSPLVLARNTAFLSRHLCTDREPDLSKARQAERGPATGEGMAGVLGHGDLGL